MKVTIRYYRVIYGRMGNATFVLSALSWHTSRAVKCRGCWGFSAKVYTESIDYISFNQGRRVRICRLAFELASGPGLPTSR